MSATPTPTSKSALEQTPLASSTLADEPPSASFNAFASGSRSYFSRHSSSHGKYPTYRPGPGPILAGTQTQGAEDLARSPRSRTGDASGGSGGGPDRQHLDNWQTLQDMIGVEDGGDDLQGQTQPLLKRRRSLRNFFTRSQDENGSGAVDILGVGSEEFGGDGLLSSSPPVMDRRQYTSGGGLGGRAASAHHESSDEGENGNAGNGSATERTPLFTESLPRRSTLRPPLPAQKRWNLWPPSPATIAVLKCAITYFIASLFTFVPALADLLSTSSETDAHGRVTRRPAYSAHMVATIVVYFNPAKTIGDMFLATRFCVILAFLATLLSLMSMATVLLFDHFSPSQGSKWDWVSEMGDWVVCVLFIGGSMGSLAWAKVWVGNPSFNSGCAMAAVTVYTVVIKEGAIPKLLEVLLIVFIGAVITNLTCFLVFPMSATSRLQSSISKSLTSFSTLLDLLTATFLLHKAPPGSNTRTSSVSLKEAVQSHGKAFKTLKTDLAEAKHERIFDSRIRGKKLELYDAAIGSLARLGQHLSALRGSTRLQEGLIRASKEGRLRLDLEIEVEKQPGGSSRPSLSPLVFTPLDSSSGPETYQDVDIETSVKLFLQFRETAGEQMDHLNERCDDALEAIQAVTGQTGTSSTDLDLQTVRNDLAASLKDFNRSSSRAIKRLYAGPRRERGVYHDVKEAVKVSDIDSEDEDEMPDLEGSNQVEGPNETVFLIYFFLFTLEEFARELLFLLDTVSEILATDSMSTMDHVRSLWPAQRNAKEKRTGYLYKQFRQVVPIDPSKLQPPLFPRNQPDSRGTLLTPPTRSLPVWLKIRQRFWELGEWLGTPNVRYALKTGLGGAILAAPAYTEAGRPIFLEYRGEWALIAYFGAISPTVGQTNFLSFFRVTGTIIGAAIAVLFYTLFPENAVVLPILGVIFSLPCFYVITQMPEYAQAGRFTLLTYNLTCLYAYNSRERDLSALSIAFHRSTSVIIGVVWAAIVSRYWWPFTARRELRMGLSDFCLDLSYLYSKLVTTYSRGVDPPEPRPDSVGAEGEEEPLLPVGEIGGRSHLGPGVRQFMAMELHLHTQLANLRDLLSQTKNEPRLKGPFAFEFYKEVLLSCERMLDRLHSMRCVTTRDEWDNGIRTAFVKPVNRQRREMAGNVILYFYTISAGFKLRTPLPPYLPPAEQARQRLVEAIRGLDVVKRRSVRGGGRHLLFFAYALAMQEVIAELEYLGGMMQDAFGVISQSTVVDFEALFQSAPGTSAGLVRHNQVV